MNIFEGITKEKFIKEFNRRDNGSLSKLHINLQFDYEDLVKGKQYSNKISLKSITNVKNYEEEIVVFNSFAPFMEFENKPILVIENYNKYLLSRNNSENILDGSSWRTKHNRVSHVYISKLGECSRDEYLTFRNIIDFENFVKADNKIKVNDKVAKELYLSLEEKQNKILSLLEYGFLDFYDKGYSFSYNIIFKKFDSAFKSKRFTEKHLIKNIFFDEFTLQLYSSKLDDALCEFNSPIPFDDYCKLNDEYLHVIDYVRQSLDCDVLINNFFNFTFKKK